MKGCESEHVEADGVREEGDRENKSVGGDLGQERRPSLGNGGRRF